MKVLLSKAGLQNDGSPGDSFSEALHDGDTAGSGRTVLPNEGVDQEQNLALLTHVITTEPLNPKDRSPRGYYRQHTLFQFFDEVRYCILHSASNLTYLLS